ncbi:NAD(P)-dependent oxidoreductase [Bacteroides cellulosilyticus]|nr:NAD(P)-dependent oxidoreductase [Bacteroides cellulosilyticus]KAA5425200.1 NAD(P)-dependent oxidoreductase [Bacteroides cellulosilyticus]KAA5436051.1 NAD(P)-dependent oxidoreductase [Bacteroides cellulosilyticus]KAA5446557.1 NAD(P)-dependent oxidoreductase [Bacteroides cellulosilyticus]UWZ87667.1 NAD(P)-dependent oxidoreductase [Bacteroides cellulosilyticus]
MSTTIKPLSNINSLIYKYKQRTNMKNVVLIGASGFVGTAILNELLNRGHKVTAIVRDPAKVTASNPNLKVIQADVTDTDVLIEASKGKDAVISAYNPGWKNPNIYEETLKNYPLIVDSVKKAGVERLLIVGGAGTLFYAPGKMVMDADDVPAKLLPGIKSLGEFYLNTLRKENDIDWIFLSPAANMTPGERTGKFRIGKDDLVVDVNGDSNISVEDYAVAMVDELEQKKYHKERFTIGY